MPFGRNKEDVLKRLKFHLGEVIPAELTVDRIVSYITEDRRITGVTASIDLTYLGGMLKVGRSLWRLPVSIAAVIDARDVLRHMNVLGRSNERDRRPTADEIERIRGWLRLHSRGLTLRCRKRDKCRVDTGMTDDDTVVWHCPACGTEERISHCQGTFWDLSHGTPSD